LGRSAIEKKEKENLDKSFLFLPFYLLVSYGAACWDPYREGQIYALDRVEKKAAKFA
jgi:hypothetical protein